MVGDSSGPILGGDPDPNNLSGDRSGERMGDFSGDLSGD